MRISRHLLVGALITTVITAGATGISSAAPVAWQPDLAKPSQHTNVSTTDGVRLGSAANRAASTRTTTRTGYAVYPHRLAEPANTFAATVDSTVPAGAELAVDVRGQLTAGWTEWTEIRPDAPAVLPVSTKDIEVRVWVAGDAVLRSLAVTPSVSAKAPSTQDAGLTYDVFATREGLVGGTTANGHVIVQRDHFVALPSRRGLSNNNSGDFSVRVCAANGRCAWAPTWDVGPWNTRDDYWNPADQREEWKDLPQGKPEAQAAFQDGYNGGRDQFGRQVANPAGIDLADGTFWDGLGLTDNSWVTVTYQWTGSDPAGFVDTNGGPLNVRAGTNSGVPIVGLAADFAQVRIECQASGEEVAGTQGTTNAWFRLTADKFVSAAYVSGGREAPAC